ncbi:1,4-dihydroxy-2-naphthoate octaprenyltransferase [Marinospirillum celere]|uniref:1,4-dihydroxy-2-naphthoate octaprenyltransferase n=1 Tax=Marinospirillum celere TaxID=1122252 RepID=A0A1I1H883_9GAMM|nr:prenyltransferase [Marinospirillum celere]SFC20369.1 1,4-dihydroxy-2-naphthoate octaprenyltransferase [Marinospirillum celere]
MVKLLIGVARPNFLTLSLVCVALAVALGWYEAQRLQGTLSLLVLVVALAAHISVNAFNEYFDFRSGLDYLTRKTPFSGGTGTLLKYPDKALQALMLASVTLLIVIGLGLWLSFQQGWELLWIGVPGVIMIYIYTQYINRSPVFCLLAPGVGFGLLMTLGAIWVLTGELTSSAWTLAVIVAFLVSNLLLLNQFPDVEADKQVGRKHFPIVLGRSASAKIFVGLLVVSYLVLLLAVWQEWLPLHSLLALLTLIPAFFLAKGVLAKAEQLDELVPFMGLNVALCHLYPLALAVSLVWASI